MVPKGRGKVLLRLLKLGGKYAYDIEVCHPDAAVSDYLAALEQLDGVESLERLRNPGGSCLGCPRCCAERIPLTSIDAARLLHNGRAVEEMLRGSRIRSLNRGVGESEVVKSSLPASARKAVAEYGWVRVWKNVVDISLRQEEDGSCIFLDRSSGTCSNYGNRPFVCRSFYCCQSSRRARLLRSAITNCGQDELVRLLIIEAGRPELILMHEADELELDRKDWPVGAFTGRSRYEEVILKEVCSPGLWQRLYRRDTK